jgi:hypothetical protein
MYTCILNIHVYYTCIQLVGTPLQNLTLGCNFTYIRGSRLCVLQWLSGGLETPYLSARSVTTRCDGREEGTGWRGKRTPSDDPEEQYILVPRPLNATTKPNVITVMNNSIRLLEYQLSSSFIARNSLCARVCACPTFPTFQP